MVDAGNMTSSVLFKLPHEMKNRNYPRYLTEKCEIWDKTLCFFILRTLENVPIGAISWNNLIAIDI